MLPANEYKALKKSFTKSVQQMLENDFYSDYKFHLEKPNANGMYWQIDLLLFESGDSLQHISNPIGFFTMQSQGKDYNDLSINHFFEVNDRVVEEFYIVHGECGFSRLYNDFKQKGGDEVSITITAYVNSTDDYFRELCDECILIIHLNETSHDSVDLGCQCSERYTIKVKNESQFIFYTVPYDKVCFFPNPERVEYRSKSKYYDYQVALSFAGEDREYVEKVAKALRKKQLRFFYDLYEEVNLWGKDLYEHLDEIYRKRSRFCVLFLSSNYKKKVWTTHERKSAQARAFEEHREYILPVRFDETEIEGIRPTVGYTDGTKKTPLEIAAMIEQKIRQS